jgi:V/A-type H+-transporting ATPase subunit F
MKVLVIGHPEAVLGFSLVGVDGKVATSTAETIEALNYAVSTPDIGIVLITQDVARLVESQMDQLKQSSTTPLVVEIPPPEGVPPDEPPLSEVVQRAIGIRI